MLGWVAGFMLWLWIGVWDVFYAWRVACIGAGCGIERGRGVGWLRWDLFGLYLIGVWIKRIAPDRAV